MCALKDKKSKEDNSNLVYQIKCNECDSVYIGESGRELKERLHEHRRNLASKYENCRDSGHDINFENVEILANCNRRNIRLFLEASFSKANSLSINRHLEIPPYYNEIINKYAKK